MFASHKGHPLTEGPSVGYPVAWGTVVGTMSQRRSFEEGGESWWVSSDTHLKAAIRSNLCLFPGGSEVKGSACYVGDLGSIPGSGRRKWQSTPAFLPGESHGRRSLVGYSPRGRRVGHDWATSLHFMFVPKRKAVQPLILKETWRQLSVKLFVSMLDVCILIFVTLT